MIFSVVNDRFFIIIFIYMATGTKRRLVKDYKKIESEKDEGLLATPR